MSRARLQSREPPLPLDLNPSLLCLSRLQFVNSALSDQADLLIMNILFCLYFSIIARVWNLLTGQEKMVLTTSDDKDCGAELVCLAITPDGSTVAAFSGQSNNTAAFQ